MGERLQQSDILLGNKQKQDHHEGATNLMP